MHIYFLWQNSLFVVCSNVQRSWAVCHNSCEVAFHAMCITMHTVHRNEASSCRAKDGDVSDGHGAAGGESMSQMSKRT